MDRHLGRLLAPVRPRGDGDFQGRAGAPPRMPRAERTVEPLPVVVPEPRRARWQARTAKPRLAQHRELLAGAPRRPRRRAASTAAEAAFICEVLGADRVVVRGNDIAQEIAGADPPRGPRGVLGC